MARRITLKAMIKTAALSTDMCDVPWDFSISVGVVQQNGRKGPFSRSLPRSPDGCLVKSQDAGEARVRLR